MDARVEALRLLTAVLVDEKPLDQILSADGGKPMEPRDRAFARNLVATTLRRLGQIDALFRPRLKRPLNSRKVQRSKNILRLGVCELLFLGTPPHAAVGSAVGLAKMRSESRVHAGLINAVLRRLSEDGPRERAEQDAARMNTPDWLWDCWSDAWGEDKARAIAATHLAEAPTDLTLKGEAGDLADSLPAQKLAAHSLRTTRSGAVTGWPGFDDGTWWVQDLAASLPARLLGDVAGQQVIDLCAAPGGKTLQLAAMGAKVTALDISAPRLGRVQENLARTGLDADLVEGDALVWRPDAPTPFVLLDAPCSATGTCRRHPDLPRLRTEDQVAELAALQTKMLDAAAAMVAPGGTLLYATCSLQPEEGEEQASAFLRRHSDWQLSAIMNDELMGLPLTVTDGQLRILPCDLLDQGGMDGFFIARFRKGSESV